MKKKQLLSNHLNVTKLLHVTLLMFIISTTAAFGEKLGSQNNRVTTEPETKLIITDLTTNQVPDQPQQKTISGTVKSTTGETLPGVSVLVKGTTVGTVTDIDGRFSLVVPANAETLQISFVGMKAQEIAITGQTTFNITMEQEEYSLGEVVAIGYGTVRKSDLTGAVSSVNAKIIENNPVSRIDQVMQGRAAGVQITQSSGAPGAGTQIRVRGGNSIEGNNEPLWVIDGIIVGTDFNLNNLNANDVESIEILKDASSIAIYGSRGANGVILVNTKSGTVTGGKPRINLGLYTGMQLVPKEAEYLTQEQQIEYTNEDARFRSAAEPFPNAPSTYPNIDWPGLLLDPSPIHNADLSIAGSSESGNVMYYNSLNYFYQDGLIKNSGIDKFIFRSNLDFHLSETLHAGFRLNYSRIHRDNGTVGYGGLLGILPTQPAYNEDGSYNGWNDVVGSPFGNPLASANLNINETFTNNFLATGYLEYKPNDQFTIRSTFSPEINNTKTNIFNSSQMPDLEVGDAGSAEVRILSSLGWNNENTIQYQTVINDDHSITALAGASFQKFSAEGLLAQAYGITSDATTFNNLGNGSDPTRNIVGSDYTGFQIVSFFGRLNYAYKSKYLLTLVGRTDGSSRFAKGNKYAFFPSVAAAWKISEESFMEDASFVSDLKLRGSYGRSGSQGIDSYRTLAIMEEANTTYNSTQNPGLTLGRPASPLLKWETTKQLDIALEASFFRGRIFTELNYYRKQTDDLLLEVIIPRQTGFTSQLQNIGSLENKGWEFLLRSTNISQRDFSWKSTLMLSANRNKVLDLGGQEFIDVVFDEVFGAGGLRIIQGEPTPVFTGVRYLGTWKNQAEIDAAGMTGQVVGGPRFEDLNGDKIISNEDNVVLGSPQADLIFGLENTITVKDFDLSFFFQGTTGNEVYNLRTRYNLMTRGETTKYAEAANRWTEANPTSDIQRAGADAFTSIPSNSNYVEDGSHIRLKTLRLTYNLPVKSWGWKGVDRMSVYFLGTNLFIASNYRLIDPESSNYADNAVFGNIAQGFSSGEYPNSRVLTLGVNVTF